MSNPIDVIVSDATKLAELIRTKEVSPVEVVQAHLDRITAVNRKINLQVEPVRVPALEKDFALDVFNRLHVMEMKAAFAEMTTGHEPKRSPQDCSQAGVRRFEPSPEPPPPIRKEATMPVAIRMLAAGRPEVLKAEKIEEQRPSGGEVWIESAGAILLKP
jgi:hypothetical protein